MTTDPLALVALVFALLAFAGLVLLGVLFVFQRKEVEELRRNVAELDDNLTGVAAAVANPRLGLKERAG